MMPIGQPVRITATGDQDVTGAAGGGRLHRILVEGAATAVLLKHDGGTTFASVSGEGSHEVMASFVGQLQVNRTGGTAVTAVWS